jgi:hypothetical protein
MNTAPGFPGFDLSPSDASGRNVYSEGRQIHLRMDRMTWITCLLRLAPEIQEQFQSLPDITGGHFIS